MTMHDDLATSAASEAQPGTTAGVTPAGPPGYELLDEVGRGGMGVVYRARDVALGRDVAVKLLAERYPLGSPAAQRFVNEARITGQLQHPGIPAVHQVGHLPDGRPFLAMKLIKGCTLEALLKDRPDPSAERGRLLAVFEAVCQAVGYAHAHRVIHRDLKSSGDQVLLRHKPAYLVFAVNSSGRPITVPAFSSHSSAAKKCAYIKLFSLSSADPRMTFRIRLK
jgi:serine/threonine protein kinase